MAQNLRVGLVGETEVLVSDQNTAERFGNPGTKVFATPMLVSIMEEASIHAISTYLDESEGTVGTRVDIQHLAATPIGMKVKARATLVEIKGKKLVFQVEAFDDIEKVGTAIHERFIIDKTKFFAKIELKNK